jgi:hypothetical protein
MIGGYSEGKTLVRNSIGRPNLAIDLRGDSYGVFALHLYTHYIDSNYFRDPFAEPDV